MSIDIFDIPPHPAADVFPMLPDDELEELAADIKANGLQQPLVVAELDGQPVLIDGRNRREACRRAGIIPDHVLLDGQDPVAYILSANINRRHMTKGQRAMAVAKIWSVSDQTSREVSDQTRVSKTRLISAGVVLKHAPDLADQVVEGSLSLDKAYEEARIRKGRADTHESRFNALKSAAPDLAEMVVEEKLTLEEAEAALREREARIQREKVLLGEALHDMAKHAYLLEHEAQRERVAEFVLSEAELYKKISPDPIDEVPRALSVFSVYADQLIERIVELREERKHVEKG